MNYYHEMNVSLGNLLVAISLCSVDRTKSRAFALMQRGRGFREMLIL